MDFESYTASLAGQAISMNAKELEILEYLLQHEGKARTRSRSSMPSGRKQRKFLLIG
ncbi:Two-component response regulator VncR [Streptococcus oralis]|uniref:Two-component response regulator VncR n=1 Tax=Streptococcus oralis TaxID=1303 RepID=A0A139PHZ5_STROR|nr:Two-component response regulator VncR [Streptococcus oralis]